MREQDVDVGRENLTVRLAIGLIQGILLYMLNMLSEAMRAHGWPATVPMLDRALWLAFSFAPVIFMQGLGAIRLPRLILWSAAAGIIAAGLGAYDPWRGGASQPGLFFTGALALNFFVSAGFFIAHALVTGGDQDRRFMATYPTHFDVAWKLALQLVLLVFFELAFWGLLWLGAFLFQLLGLSFLRTLIIHSWFAIPVSALVVAGGLHLTDIQPGLVRGMRTLILALFSWLLPLMTLLAGGFLLALLSTGLQPLWRIGHASGELLTAAALLIILINAMYQDGARAAPAFLKYAGRIAALTLAPLVILAGYALSLRVGQYGWSVARVATAACVLVAGFYALGYAVAALLPGPALRLIERWNFAAALLVLAVLLSLFSPIADPARIAVNSQVARLQSGAISAAKFDFNYLRNAQRFGHDALLRLIQSPDPLTRQHAQEALNGRFVSPIRRINAQPVPGHSPVEIASFVIVHPDGKHLPQSFLTQDWNSLNDGSFVPRCASNGRIGCEALVADLDGDGKDDVLLFTVPTRGNFFNATLFEQESDGHWHYEAMLGYPHCPGDLEALRAGQFKLVPAGKPDAQLAGRHVTLNWARRSPENCPAAH